MYPNIFMPKRADFWLQETLAELSTWCHGDALHYSTHYWFVFPCLFKGIVHPKRNLSYACPYQYDFLSSVEKKSLSIQWKRMTTNAFWTKSITDSFEAIDLYPDANIYMHIFKTYCINELHFKCWKVCHHSLPLYKKNSFKDERKTQLFEATWGWINEIEMFSLMFICSPSPLWFSFFCREKCWWISFIRWKWMLTRACRTRKITQIAHTMSLFETIP